MLNILVALLYKFLIICICFEEAFSRMWLPFRYFKYMIIPVIAGLVFVKLRGRLKFKLQEKSVFLFVLLTAFVAFFSVGDFIAIDRDGMEVIKKYAFVPFLFFCFYHSDLFRVKGSVLVRFFAQSMVLYSLLSVFLYFVRIPIWNDFQRFYWGRVTVGYPTIDVVNCAIAVGILFFCSEREFSIFHKIVDIFVLVVFIILQTSGTGFGLLFGLLVGTIFCVCFKFKLDSSEISNIKKVAFGVGVVLFTFGSSVYGFLNRYDPMLLDNMTLQFENRVAIMMSEKNSDLDLNTMEMREDKYEKAKELYLKTPIDEFFGAGFGKVSYNPKKHFSGTRVFLESQWHLELFSEGYLGGCIMLLIFVEIGKGMLMSRKVRLYSLYGLCCIFVSLFTSCTFMSFALSGSFMLLFAEHKQRLIEGNV